MFCAKCGSKLEEEARFCTKCGAPIDESRPEEGRDEDGAAPCSAERPKTAPGAEDAPNATRPDVAAPTDAKAESTCAPSSAPDALAETTDPGSDTLKAAVEATKHRSRRRVPLVLLIALALTLISGVAYAAFWVYTEVVLPQIEASQQEPATDEGETQAADVADEQPAQPQGNPRHILQLAEILSMENPVDIPAFLESQGLAMHEENPVMGASPDSGAFWGCAADDTAPFTALSDDGVSVEAQDYPKSYASTPADETADGASVMFGVDVMPPHGIGLYYDMASFTIDEGDLLNSTMPNCVLVNNLPLPLLDDEQAAALAESCGLPIALATFSDEEEGVMGSTTARVGFLTIDGEKYCWYLCQMDVKGAPTSEGATPAYVRSFIGCCPVEQASKAVADNALHTDEEWAAADDSGRALMLAQSIVQGMHITNGGYRTNVISGEMEFSYLEENPDATGTDPYVRTWMTKDELAAKEGAETAERVFGAVGNQGTGN